MTKSCHRVLLLLFALTIPAVLRADGTTAVLGPSGELYHVVQGTYRSLFPNAPAGQATNSVLALEITTSGNVNRIVVPGTDGLESEGSPTLAFDRTTNRLYVVWLGRINVHSVIYLAGYSADGGFGEVMDFVGDAFSLKGNPQLATTSDDYQALGPDDRPVAVSRTIFHLVWRDDSDLGPRVLYAPLVIDNGNVLSVDSIFDLRDLAGGGSSATPHASPSALSEHPQIRSGRDDHSVVIAFIDSSTGELVTLEVRSVDGDLVSFTDKARAVTIDTGRSTPNTTPAQLASLTRREVERVAQLVPGDRHGEAAEREPRSLIGGSL